MAVRADPGLSNPRVDPDGPDELPGQEALIFASTWQPGFRLPLHMHPEGHEFTFVLEGEQTFEIEGVGEKIVKAGEVLYNPPNTPHYGRNATDKGFEDDRGPHQGQEPAPSGGDQALVSGRPAVRS